MSRKSLFVCLIGSLAVLSLAAVTVWAQQEPAETDTHVVYRVRVTNLTKGQPFSRIVVATHRPGVRWVELGAEAPAPLVALAEEGNPLPLATYFSNHPGVRGVAVSDGPLAPGDSLVLHVKGGGPATKLSAAGMLVLTNDGFFAVNGALVPPRRDARTVVAAALDAGSEANDEQCGSIPGPYCGGDGGLDGEGFVHVHNGVHGIGDLVPPRHDWRNPVARVHVERIAFREPRTR